MAVTGPWLFAAGIPPLVRSGPEGYKGFFIVSLFIPLFVLLLAAKRARPHARTSLPLVTAYFGPTNRAYRSRAVDGSLDIRTLAVGDPRQPLIQKTPQRHTAPFFERAP